MKKNPEQWVLPRHALKKSLRMIRWSLFFFCIGIIQVFAVDSYSQQTRFSMKFESEVLENVLNEIENQSEYYFLYNQDYVDVDQKVNITVSDQKIDELLNQLLKSTGIEYTIQNRQIVLTNSVAKIFSGQAKLIKVSGKVTDSTGAPLPGVTVVVKETTNGTIANFDGIYSLSDVPSDGIIQFSFVGMKTLEISVAGKTSIDVVLEEDAIGIEEVIAVGYGVQKKVNLTGSISTVNFDQELDNRPITNASQALSGKVSGIWVTQLRGKPGSDDSQIRVRGWGTLNNSNPLIIIDGVEGAFNQINPNDIESITVLKDAASAAIYGSKAANGVILISTKDGNKNEKMEVELSSYIGVQSLGRSFDMIDNSVEYMEMWNKARANAGSTPLFSESLISAFRTGNDKYKYPNTDWYDVIFDNAIMHEHNISVRGGSAKSSTFLSANYLDHDGMLPNTTSKRYGLRANMKSSVNDWLNVSGRFNYIRKSSVEPYNLGRVWTMLEGANSFTSPYTRDGGFGSVEAIDENGTLLYDNRNPLIDAANGATNTENDFLTASASVEIKLYKDLILKTTLASTGTWALVDKYNESLFGYTDSGMETMTKNYNREGMEISRSQVSTHNNNLYTTLNYSKTFAENHDISAIAGMQMENWISKNVFARRTDAPKEGLTQVDAGTDGIKGEGNMNGVKMFSYFGRLNYSYKSKYLFETNIRADASSRFRKGNRWGIFPGFSAGWRLIDENFIQNLDLFSNLKLRASWGQLGNQNISGNWPYLTIIAQNYGLSYSYNGNLNPGAAATALIDENITWETTSTLDFGLDLGFMNNQLTIEADYFNKTTRDIIVQLPIPSLMGGLTAPFENVGEMVNKGFEITVNYDNKIFQRSRLGYSVEANFSYVNNEVTKFREGDSPDQLYLIREGYSYKSLYGYNVVGIYQSNEEAAEHMYANSYKPKAGNLKFEDVNDDGKLGFEDKKNLGNTIPKYTFGLSSSFRYKGFDLNIMFQGIAGAHLFTKGGITIISSDNPTMTKKWRNAWTPQNRNTDIPSIKFNDSWDNSESSFWVHEISFLKLKNIQLGYNCPEKFTSILGLQKMYVYANAQNVFTMVNKGYEGYDPERVAFDSGHNFYPVPRIISVGLNLNF